MRCVKTIELLESELRITDENSDYVNTEMWDEAQVFLIVASKTGSPTTLDAAIHYSCDGGTTYAPTAAAANIVALEAFTQVTGSTSNQVIKLHTLGRGFRVQTVLVGGSAGVGWTYYVTVVLKRLS
ncbi:MAG TPA: hypothetical protein VMY39_03325 [Planctomycetota bacterium]|nr:hypothetical protein [Planctomycetota bacterium]